MIYWVAIATAFMTAFYTGRAFFMTFFGPEKLRARMIPRPRPPSRLTRHGHGHGEDGHADAQHHDIGHESPPIMVFPL